MKVSAKQLAQGLYREIEERGADQLDTVVEGFVDYLAKTHQISRWREVVQALDQVWREVHGVARVHVVSKHRLSETLIRALEKSFAGASVTSEIDEQVLGGASIQIDDRIVDGTLSGRLQSLKIELAKGVGSSQ